MEQDEAARVRALGEIAAEFDLDAIRVRTGDTEIEIVRRDPAVHAAPAPPVYAALPAAAPPPAADGGGELPAPAGRPPNHRVVTAPLVGVFYRSANPDAEPYVEVGTRVSVGQTLCILEAMKLMNELTSEVDGVVARVLSQNGELVSLGQELFWIAP